MLGEMKWCPSYYVYQLFQWSYSQLTTLFLFEIHAKNIYDETSSFKRN